VADVKSTDEVRSSLPSILATLRRNPEAEAWHCGSHRHDEQQSAAVPELEELERLGAQQMVRHRLADARFSEGTVDDLFDPVDPSA